MDKQRIDYGTNRKFNDKPVRTYNHYIFSPDPKDEISTDELENALKE